MPESVIKKMDNKAIKKIVVLGLGRIGATIAHNLSNCADYQVTAADINKTVVDKCNKYFNSQLITDNKFDDILKGQHAVVSALSFNENPMVAQAALRQGCSYFDLTEDIECTRKIKEIASKAKADQIFMPQCGLAPGFVGILAFGFCHEFEILDTLKLRVGALPEFPSNQMMYNLTWSTEGLVNEYANSCESIKNHELTELEPLEGREILSISGIEYEAFNTSGGLANLCYSLKGKIRELTYKTIRYPGHCELMRFLFRDLRLGEMGKRRNMLMEILDSSVAKTEQDIVLVSVVATGWLDKILMQKSRNFLIKNSHGKSAIQLSTAAGLCTVLDLFMSGELKGHGFVEQESIDIKTFLNNRFAKLYKDSELK